MTVNLIPEAEDAAAHLVVLGFWPIRWEKWGKKYIGVRSKSQYVSVRWGRVQIEAAWEGAKEQEIEWWVLTDAVVLQIAKTMDNTLIGWGE